MRKMASKLKNIKRFTVHVKIAFKNTAVNAFLCFEGNYIDVMLLVLDNGIVYMIILLIVFCQNGNRHVFHHFA